MAPDMSLWRQDDLTERRQWRPVAEQQTEQLDLFADNRRTIWLNQAYDALRCLDFDAAMVKYGKIVEARLDDPEIRDEFDLVVTWRERLARHRESPREVTRIHRLYGELADTRAAHLPDPLNIALLEFITAELSTLDTPELIFIPPRFHVGLICCRLENYKEAEAWFERAVDAGIEPMGKFLAYRGDALCRLGAADAALDLYREAFLQDPLEVDLSHLADQNMRELIAFAESEAEEPDELLPWLPVWGWLRNLFTLGPNGSRTELLESLQKAEEETRVSTPRLWFEYLRYAEFLRGVQRDDQELIRARRRLKELNGELFGRYIKKIGKG